MKTIIYLALFLISLKALASPEKDNLEIDQLIQDEKAIKKQADYKINEWSNGLFEELMNHDNPNVRIFAIGQFRNPESSDFNQQKLDELNDFIYNIISDETAGFQALTILSAYCDNNRQEFQCDTELLMQKLMALEPNNMASYVSLINKALELQDSIKISETLSIMANATYHNHHFNVLPELEQAVFEFTEKNPFPQSYIDSSMQTFGLDNSKVQYSQQELEDNLLYSQLIGMKMAIAMPPYRVFSQACKDTSALSEECLKIADILINNSYTGIAKMLGYAIKMEIYKKSGDDKLYDIVKESEVKFSKEYTCIIKSLMPTHDSGFIMTKEIFKSSNKVEIESGELASFKKLAELHYQENIEKGNNSAINPSSCYH